MSICAMMLTTGNVAAFAPGVDSTIAGKILADSESKATP